MAQKPRKTKSDDMLKSKIMISSYENITVKCPYCDKENKYNRVTELKTIEPIANMEVTCQNLECANKFHIYCDNINPKYEQLILQCEFLKESKEYMFCILSIVQSYEVFFSTFLQVNIIYRPYVNYNNIEWMNDANNKLYEKIGKLTYVKLRNIFLNLIVSEEYSINDLDHKKVNRIIRDIDSLTTNPKDEKLWECNNEELYDLLLKIKRSKANVLRNKVIHKSAYRPSLDEVESCLSEARKVIFSLASSLQILDDDVNSYV